jgi:glutamine amidotransferase-like uncharacterized protein
MTNNIPKSNIAKVSILRTMVKYSSNLAGIIIGLIVLSTSLVALQHITIVSGQESINDLTGIDVAVYTGGPTSTSSRDALAAMFRWMNATVVILSAASIKAGVLSDYDLLIIPGGYAADYIDDLGYSGITQIRSFVEGGGAFFGICAGAYLACDKIVWEGSLIDYPLNLFDGTGTGAIDAIAEWPNYDMCVIDLNKSNTIIDLSDEPDNHTVMYYGGPYFTISDSSGVNVLARYQINNYPAMIAFEHEEGRVFLSGPHPEWEEDSNRDGESWPDGFDDVGSEWNMMLTVSLWLTEIPLETTTTTTTSSTMYSPTPLGLLFIGIGAFGVIVIMSYMVKKGQFGYIS